jgi:hypothetical protein
MTQPALPVPPVPPPLPGEPVAVLPVNPALPGPPPRKLLRLMIVASLCLLLAGAAVGIAAWDYALLERYSYLRAACLLSLIIASGFATLLFGGIMNCLDRVLEFTPPPPWYARVFIDLIKRLLLVVQLVTTAATLVALGALFLPYDIPML